MAHRSQPSSSISLPHQVGANSTWANDFQKLRLNAANSPIPQSQFRSEAPLHRSQVGPSGWHAEFMQNRQSSQSTPSTASLQGHMNSNYAFNSNGSMTYNGFGVNQIPQPLQVQGDRASMQQTEVMNDAAFEDAFARAEIDHISQEEVTMDYQQESHKVQEPEPIPQHDLETSEHIRIGSDLIEDRKAPINEQQEQAEADELARTAGDLLNALKHDQSDKFQHSQFLSLMRRIRDREVEVKNDDFKEVSSADVSSCEDICF